MLSQLISSLLAPPPPPPQGVLASIQSQGTTAGGSAAIEWVDVVPGRAIGERVMGTQGHLVLRSQVLALQLTASSIIDRGKPIRTICSPQRSAGAA